MFIKESMEDFINEGVKIDDIPFKEWEMTSMDAEGGKWCIAKYKGKYYTAVGYIEPGSVGIIDDLDDYSFEQISKKEYQELEKEL